MVEKLVAAGGDDVTSTPLAGVVDQVVFNIFIARNHQDLHLAHDAQIFFFMVKKMGG